MEQGRRKYAAAEPFFLEARSKTEADLGVEDADDLSFLRARFEDVELSAQPLSAARVRSAGAAELKTMGRALKCGAVALDLSTTSSANDAAHSPRPYVRSPQQSFEQLAENTIAERARRCELIAERREAEARRRKERRANRLEQTQAMDKRSRTTESPNSPLRSILTIHRRSHAT